MDLSNLLTLLGIIGSFIFSIYSSKITIKHFNDDKRLNVMPYLTFETTNKNNQKPVADIQNKIWFF